MEHNEDIVLFKWGWMWQPWVWLKRIWNNYSHHQWHLPFRGTHS